MTKAKSMATTFKTKDTNYVLKAKATPSKTRATSSKSARTGG